MKILFIFLSFMTWLAVSPAQSMECPPSPNQVTVTVQADVQPDFDSDLYVYRYTVTNDATSQQDLDDFAIDFAPPIQDIVNPEDWTSDIVYGRDSVLWGALGEPIITPDLPPAGIPPDDAQLAPGATLSGFGFKSPNPPGPVTFYARGFFQPFSFPTELEVERFMEECPDAVGTVFDLAYTGTTLGPVDFIPVTIDIKPGEDPNSINPRARGVTPVAVLSTEDFDALGIEPASARFGPGEAAPEQPPGYNVEDVDGDGRDDLVFFFDNRASGLDCEDNTAELTATTLEGTPVRGADDVNIVGCR